MWFLHIFNLPHPFLSCADLVSNLVQPFCSLTGYPYEIYVDPERCIYQKLGMKREEKFTDSGTVQQQHILRWWLMKDCIWRYVFIAHPSPHVKSGMFMGQMKSIWRAMTSPAFDFQGDLHQQGGAIIAGPGKLGSLFPCILAQSYFLSPPPLCYIFSLFFPSQALKFIFPILTWTAWTTCPLTGSCSSLEFNRLWTSVISQRLSMCSQLAGPHHCYYAGMYTCCLFSYITTVHESIVLYWVQWWIVTK